MHAIGASTGLYIDVNDIIRFSGNGDLLNFARGAGDTVTAVGTNQTIGFDLTGPDTVIDKGYNLHLVLDRMVSQLTVKDFQHDPLAHVTLAYGQTGALAPDGHGGQLLSLTMGTGPGALHIGSVDFVGDRHPIAITQG